MRVSVESQGCWGDLGHSDGTEKGWEEQSLGILLLQVYGLGRSPGMTLGLICYEQLSGV